MCAGLFLSVSACIGDSSSSGGGGSSGSGDKPGIQAPNVPMVLIPAETFTMGSKDTGELFADEKPEHEVVLNAFQIDTYEVTVADYKTCVDKAGSNCKTPKKGTGFNWGVTGRDKHPVNGVDWDDATAYCQFAGKRLPTASVQDTVSVFFSAVHFREILNGLVFCVK